MKKTSNYRPASARHSSTAPSPTRRARSPADNRNGGEGASVIATPARPQRVIENPAREFAELVEESLEGGLLRYTKRLELIRVASTMGIERFNASLIIAEVQYRHGRTTFLSPGEDASVKKVDAAKRKRSMVLLRLAAMLIIATLANLLIMNLFFK